MSHQLGPSLTGGSAGVRREPRPAAGADLTGPVTVRHQGKAAGPVAHAGTGGTCLCGHTLDDHRISPHRCAHRACGCDIYRPTPPTGRTHP